MLVLRTAPEAAGHAAERRGQPPADAAGAGGRAGLLVDGAEAGGGRWRPRPGFDEWLLRVPAALVRAREARLELRGRYAAFRYWLYQ